MQVLFEEDGELKTGAVLSSTDSSSQVELPGGRRSKVKAASILLRFERPGGPHLLEEARREAAGVDLDFLWQCAPQQEFGFEELAREYFGHAPGPVEAATILLRVHGAPVYFHRKGKGRFRPAPPEVLQAALAGVARRRAQDEQRARDVAELVAGGLPESIRALGAGLLLRADRNGLPYKTVEQAAYELKTTPLRLLLARGAIASPYAWHFESFLARHFPRGPGFDEALPAPGAAAGELPLSPARAFSLDDASTTEIDDAFSVTAASDGGLRIGIHIAAPALAFEAGSPVDLAARARLSTVYAPGVKITMLPPAWIAASSLDEGREVPCLSLYLELGADGLPHRCETVVDRVLIAANLRHDDLTAVATPERLASAQAAEGLPFGAELAVLWQLAQALLKRREAARGRPEIAGRVDYSVELDGEGEDARVLIRPRLRDAPLDRLVAELMIFANSHWGGWLAGKDIAAVYRSQTAGRVRMSTTPAPHEGLGVTSYAWCTSPLRRYVDLVNQRQLVAAVRGSAPAFERGDASLFAIVSAFDAAYGAYADFQALMERYWCLRWIEQNALERCGAVVLRDDGLRLEPLPLFIRLPGLPALPRRSRVEIELLGHDLLELSVQARLVRVLQAGDGADGSEAAGDPGDYGEPAVLDGLAAPAEAAAAEDGAAAAGEPADRPVGTR